VNTRKILEKIEYGAIAAFIAASVLSKDIGGMCVGFTLVMNTIRENQDRRRIAALEVDNRKLADAVLAADGVKLIGAGDGR
jgi:hypothetical protein